jgi:hypothetical protein
MPSGPGRLYVLAECGPVDGLVGAALEALGDGEALCLAPDYNPELCSALERSGFEETGRFVTLARRLNQPVEELAREAVKAVPAS